MAIVCYVAAAIQVLGLFGVAQVSKIQETTRLTGNDAGIQEKSILYRRYVTLHIMAIVAVFAVAAAWAIVSASRHSAAQANCIKDFFPDSASGSPTASEGEILCNIFPWVDVGIMGGLWVFFAAVHVRLDHRQSHVHVS